MKKLGAGFAALGVFLMIAVGCNSSGNDSSSTGGGNSTGGSKSNIQVTNALVRQVRVGMTEQEVRDLLGEPRLLLPMGNPNEAAWVYDVDGGIQTIVAFVDGKVPYLPSIDGKPQ